jgi:hypothetical protein
MHSAQELLRRHGIEYKPTRNGKFTTNCPECGGDYLSVETKRGIVVWYCHRCKWGGPEKSDEQRDSDLGPIKAVYDYGDEKGELLFQVVRFEPVNQVKQFHQRKGPDQKKWSIKGVRIVPYRLPHLIEAIAADQVVFVVEGEKDCDTLAAHGVVATTNPMGAGKWPDDFAQFFVGADVIVCGDNDAPGRDHVATVTNNLRGVVRRLRHLDLAKVWPEIEESDDISNWFDRAGGTVEALWQIVEALPDAPKGNGRDDPGVAPVFNAARKRHDSASKFNSIPPKMSSPVIRSLATLRTKIFPPVNYVVPGYVVQGCTLLTGNPKIGKSWWVLDIGLAVPSGGECLGGVKCEQGDVLYLALEDNERRIQNHVTKILGYSVEWPPGFHYATEWPRGEAGLTQIRNWVAGQNNPRLVMIDVLAMFRPPRTNQQTTYEADYAALQGLRQLASDTDVAILAVSHLRKAGADSDPFEKISGTYGLTGATDTALILDRDAFGTTLYGRGRDIPEIEQAVEFDKETCRWRVLGNPADVRRTSGRKAILDVLKAANGVARTPSNIAVATGMTENNVRQLLYQMGMAGEVRTVARGQYVTDL